VVKDLPEQVVTTPPFELSAEKLQKLVATNRAHVEVARNTRSVMGPDNEKKTF